MITYLEKRDVITTNPCTLPKCGYTFRAQRNTSTFCSIYIHAARTNKNKWVGVVRSVAGKEIRSQVPVKIVGRTRRKIEASAGLRKAQLRPATVARALKSLKKRKWDFLPVLPAWCAPGHRCPSGITSFSSPSHALLLPSLKLFLSAARKENIQGIYSALLLLFSLSFSSLSFFLRHTHFSSCSPPRKDSRDPFLHLCPRQIINFWLQECTVKPVYLLPFAMMDFYSFFLNKILIRETRPKR